MGVITSELTQSRNQNQFPNPKKNQRKLRKKKGGGHPACGASAGKKSRAGGKRAYPKCVPRAKAKTMTKGQIKSAVQRKRAAGNPGGKPTNVKTILKSKNTTKKRSTRKV